MPPLRAWVPPGTRVGFREVLLDRKVARQVRAAVRQGARREHAQNDVGKLVANVQALTSKGAKAIVMAPQDTGAIASTLDRLEQKKIPVVTVDTRPDRGKVFMVVRADNRAYGEKACKFLGDNLGGKGKIVEFQGAARSSRSGAATSRISSPRRS